MATNYPTWNTLEGHGRPLTGYYWGNDPRGPIQGSGFEYEIMDHGLVIVITKMWEGTPAEYYSQKVTMPCRNYFWWSSELPSLEWWRERDAQRRHAIADRDEQRSITSGTDSSRLFALGMGPSHTGPGLWRGTITEDARDRTSSMAEERMRTAPISHEQFRHPLQGKPKGQDSEYCWILGSPVFARSWGSGDAVLVHDTDCEHAAIVRVEKRFIVGGPTVHVITVNAQIFQWGMESSKIMHIITSAKATWGHPDAVVYPEEAGAQPAPGQPEDNFVVPLACGHELDLPFDPGKATRYYCVPCGMESGRVFPRGEHPYPYSHERENL